MNAAWMRERTRPIPVIVFTAHLVELAESQIGISEPSKKAAFQGSLPRPFDLLVWSRLSATASKLPRPFLFVSLCQPWNQ
jgi:hypothetical protein